jgi:hypothetical protein
MILKLHIIVLFYYLKIYSKGGIFKMDINELVGKTLTSIDIIDKTEIIFSCTDGTKYRMYHWQDCCEEVRLDDVCGNISDLIGTPIIMAEESSNERDVDWEEHETWTFYKLATNKGYVTLKWWGESNGYYSEEVDFEKI